jgi:glycolate oxidase iron-sulfur subunit
MDSVDRARLRHDSADPARLRHDSADPARLRHDELDPTGELTEIVGDCVHCGFCLTSCPTYQLWGEEMDSPRGRIHLISQLLDGANASPAAAAHLDRCLGCMACVPACPAGVRYDRLIEAARSWATESSSAEPVQALPARSARERALRAAIFATFPYPQRLRWLMGPLHAAQRTRLDRLMERTAIADRLAPELASALRLAPGRPAPGRPAPGRPARRVPRGRLPDRVPARGQRRAVVGCSPAAFSRSSFRTSMSRPPMCSRPRAATS